MNPKYLPNHASEGPFFGPIRAAIMGWWWGNSEWLEEWKTGE
jgi:carbon starvation protein CstA